MKFEHIIALLNTLSWIKIIQSIIFLIIIGVAYGLWENRAIVYNSLRVSARVEMSAPIVLSVTEETGKLIDSSIEKAKDKIAAIQVVNVDFKKNIRYIAYSSIADPSMKKSYQTYVENKIAELSLFTDKEVDNQIIINLINGDLVCVDFKKSLGYSMFAKSDATIHSVCAVSIPPYYGRFSGYLTVYIKTAPTDDDMTIVRQILRDISLRIYETDESSQSSFKKVG